MAISKAKQLEITRQANKSAEPLTAKQQEDFIATEIKIQTALNEEMDDLLNTYRQELAPFVVGDIPIQPGRTNETIETTTVKIKMILQEILTAVSPINNAGIKVMMLDCIHQGLKVLQKASIDKDILLKRVLGGKEN